MAGKLTKGLARIQPLQEGLDLLTQPVGFLSDVLGDHWKELLKISGLGAAAVGAWPVAVAILTASGVLRIVANRKEDADQQEHDRMAKEIADSLAKALPEINDKLSGLQLDSDKVLDSRCALSRRRDDGATGFGVRAGMTAFMSAAGGWVHSN